MSETVRNNETAHPKDLAVRGSRQGRPAARRIRQGPGAVRDRLRSVRPAAYRHVRRGGAHHLGAPRVHRAHRPAVAADRVQRRHGRAAQGARQRAQPRPADAASRQAADPHPRPVRLARQLRRAQQRAAARVPGLVRVRLRIRLVHRVLRRRPVRRGADPRAGMLRRGDGGHPAHPRPRASRHLFADPADPSAHRPRHAGADGTPRSRRRHRGLARSGQRRGVRNLGEGRRLQAAVEGRLGDALVRARRRLRDVGQGPDRFSAPVGTHLPHPRQPAAGRLHL